MFKLRDVDHMPIANGLAVAASAGFTPADLIALSEVHAAAVARRVWGRGQLVANEFADYLAVWGPQTGGADPPALALARFKRTGTYVLTIGMTVVAGGKRLEDVLPALSAGFDETTAATRS
jgi:hypothetical protein